MPVIVEIQNTGFITTRSEIVASIEHALVGRDGDWRVSIVGSHANEDWEMKVSGPQGFERTYMLAGSAGEHEPGVIRSILMRLVSAAR